MDVVLARHEVTLLAAESLVRVTNAEQNDPSPGYGAVLNGSTCRYTHAKAWFDR